MSKKTHKLTMVKKGFLLSICVFTIYSCGGSEEEKSSLWGRFLWKGNSLWTKTNFDDGDDDCVDNSNDDCVDDYHCDDDWCENYEKYYYQPKQTPLFKVAYFQLAKMFIVVLIVFGLCWLPYHAYFFYTYYHVVRLLLQLLS